MNEAEARRIGYKAIKNGNHYGVELFTPKRTSAVTYDFVLGADSEKEYTVSVWADKTNAPERKLEIITIISPSKMMDMEGFQACLTIRHPLLPRDLEYSMEHHYNQGRTFHTKLDLDVFDAQHQRWVLENTIENLLVENGRNVSIVTELRSQGTGASIVFDFHGAILADSFSTGANLKLKDQEYIEKELFFFVETSPQWFTINMGSPVKQLAWEARWNADYVITSPRFQFTTTTKVFGLAPAVLAVDMDMSPRMDVKFFSEASPEVYYHFVAHVTDEEKFELALMRHNGAEKKELAGITAKFDYSDMFATRIFWKVEQLVELRTALRSHFETAKIELVNTADMLVKDLNAISSKWVAFKNLKVGSQELFSAILSESKIFLENSQKDESMREVMVVVKMIDRMVYQAIESVESFDFEMPSVNDLLKEFSRFVEEFKLLADELIHDLIDVADHCTQELDNVLYNEELVRSVTGNNKNPPFYARSYFKNEKLLY